MSTTLQTPSLPPRLAVANLKNPPPPGVYRGLQTGPEGKFVHADAETVPVDGSNALLRTLSPFILRVEPPLVYSNWTPGASQPQYGIRAPGLQGNSGFLSARQSLAALQQTTLGLGGTSTTPVTYKADGQSSASPASGTTANPDYPVGKSSLTTLTTALDIATQLKALLDAPPLVLLINPGSFQVQYTKVQQFQDRTRYGYVFQAWGEEQPKITFTARCGAFISSYRGVVRASRADSAAWQNLMSLFTFYRNNGYIYDTLGQSNAHHLVGALSIQYDQNIYYGHMDSLSFTEEETNANGGISVEIGFTASSIIDLAQPSYAVTPMRNPLAMTAWQNVTNLDTYMQPGSQAEAPGVYSVGLTKDGFFLESQGQVVAGVGSGSPALKPDAGLPGSGAASGSVQGGASTMPMGTGGFRKVAA